MGSGRKKPDPLTLVKGLTAAFEATSNQPDPMRLMRKSQGGGGGGISHNAEAEDE